MVCTGSFKPKLSYAVKAHYRRAFWSPILCNTRSILETIIFSASPSLKYVIFQNQASMTIIICNSTKLLLLFCSLQQCFLQCCFQTAVISGAVWLHRNHGSARWSESFSDRLFGFFGFFFLVICSFSVNHFIQSSEDKARVRNCSCNSQLTASALQKMGLEIAVFFQPIKVKTVFICKFYTIIITSLSINRSSK